MKPFIIHTIIRFSLCFSLLLVVSSSGVTPNTWQYWAVVVIWTLSVIIEGMK